VAALGGGSVLDAGKAVSAMLCEQGAVVDFLEGVGTGAELSGRKTPFVAIPTTAGTGSEATKNAVLSRVGPGGFKKSLRHEALVPDVALVDPALAVSCPPEVTAACGMDAFTQLLEAYTSTKASSFTDGLVEEALRRAGASLVAACTTHGADVSVRADLAYAALVSGIALANAGLGIVHGLASPIGASFDIPHGVVCGTLVGEATRMNVERLEAVDPLGAGLRRYAAAGRLLGAPDGDDRAAVAHLLDTLDRWTAELGIPTLGAYGVTREDVAALVRGAGLKNNPVPLEAEQIERIVVRRLGGA
jgi:alcohol dehydrogenase class IV